MNIMQHILTRTLFRLGFLCRPVILLLSVMCKVSVFLWFHPSTCIVIMSILAVKQFKHIFTQQLILITMLFLGHEVQLLFGQTCVQ